MINAIVHSIWKKDLKFTLVPATISLVPVPLLVFNDLSPGQVSTILQIC